MSLFVAFGFDCDVPRGAAFVRTEEGREKLGRTVEGLERIRSSFADLDRPRTFFVCGEFLETLVDEVGVGEVRRLFDAGSERVEMGNHSWSHTVVAPIPTRPDKAPLSPSELRAELDRTNSYLRRIFEVDEIPGFRTPLGHPGGLAGEDEVLDVVGSAGFAYVSSDIRCRRGGIEAPLVDERGRSRNPYRYGNGLLEIPSHGWHDTAFGGRSRTPLFSEPPRDGDGILRYFRQQIGEASRLGAERGLFCLTFVMHPVEIARYASESFFGSLIEAIDGSGGTTIDFRGISRLDAWEPPPS